MDQKKNKTLVANLQQKKTTRTTTTTITQTGWGQTLSTGKMMGVNGMSKQSACLRKI